MEIELIDICQSENQAYIELFKDLCRQIGEGDDRLKLNYSSLKLSEFASLTLIVDKRKNEILAFSGLQMRRPFWGERLARILSRYYIVPEYRNKYTLFQPEDIFGFKMFTHQLAVAQKLNLAMVFISRDTHFRAFREFVLLLNRHFDINFSILNGRFNVCGAQNKSTSCFQFVASLPLIPEAHMYFNLPEVRHESLSNQ